MLEKYDDLSAHCASIRHRDTKKRHRRTVRAINRASSNELRIHSLEQRRLELRKLELQVSYFWWYAGLGFFSGVGFIDIDNFLISTDGVLFLQSLVVGFIDTDNCLMFTDGVPLLQFCFVGFVDLDNA